MRSEREECVAGWTRVEILRDMKEKDEDGGMRRDSLWPQEAYPLLLLLLFYNELLKPSFPSLPWVEGVQRWGLLSPQPDSHAQAPRVAALSRVGGWMEQGCRVCKLLCVCLKQSWQETGEGRKVFAYAVVHTCHVHTCGQFSGSDMWVCVCSQVFLCGCGLQLDGCMLELLSVTPRHWMT